MLLFTQIRTECLLCDQYMIHSVCLKICIEDTVELKKTDLIRKH